MPMFRAPAKKLAELFGKIKSRKLRGGDRIPDTTAAMSGLDLDRIVRRAREAWDVTDIDHALDVAQRSHIKTLNMLVKLRAEKHETEARVFSRMADSLQSIVKNLKKVRKDIATSKWN